MTAIQTDLPKTMWSVVCYGPSDYRLEEIAVPTVTSGEVLVRIQRTQYPRGTSWTVLLSAGNRYAG